MNLPIWNMPAQYRALNRDLFSEVVSCLMICKWNCYCFFASHLWAPLFLTVGCLCQTIKVEEVFKFVRGFIDINEREVQSKLMTVVFHVGKGEQVFKTTALFKIYDSTLERYIPSVTVLWVSSFHIHLLQFFAMCKTGNKILTT